MERPKLEIFANDVTIKAGSNGIVTLLEGSKSGAIIIGSKDRNINSLTITSGGQGIDNKAGEIRIYGSENSKIDITSYSNQATTEELKSAINNSRREEVPNSSGIVEITGGDITISANNKANGIITNAVSTTINSNTTQIESAINGVKNISGTTTINGKDITINSSQNAVYNNGAGTINITSTGMTKGDISTLDNQYGYDISLVGEDNNGILSDGEGTTIVEADHDTVIAGKENGILSEKGKINVTAGNNNVIGQYTDEKGTHTSQNGINVSSGTVTITSGNENNIYGIQNGILATGENSNVILEGKITNIKVDNNNGNANGVNIINGAEINLNRDKNQQLNIEAISKNGDAIGLNINNGYLNKEKNLGNIKINATSDKNNAYGINIKNSDIIINSDGILDITAKRNDVSLGDKYASAINISSNNENEQSKLNINSLGNKLYGTDSAIYAFGKNTELNITATKEFNKITSYKGAAVGSVSGAIVTITAEKNENIIKSENGPGLSASFENANIVLKGKSNRIEASTNVIVATETGKITVEATDGDNILSNGTIGISSAKDDVVELKAINGMNSIDVKNRGISAGSGSIVKLTADKKNYIKSKSNGINAEDAQITLSVTDGDNEIYSEANAIRVKDSSNNMIRLDANSNKIVSSTGIWNSNEGVVILKANTLSNILNVTGYGIFDDTGANVELNANISNIIESKGDNKDAIYVNGIKTTDEIDIKQSNVKLLSTLGSNFISANGMGINANNMAIVDIESQNNNNLVVSDASAGIYSNQGANVELRAYKGYNVIESEKNSGLCAYGDQSNIKLIAKSNEIDAQFGIYTKTNSTVELISGSSNHIFSSNYGIYADDKSNVVLSSLEYNYLKDNASEGTGIYANDAIVNLSGRENDIIAGTIDTQGFGSGHAIQAESASDVDLNAIGGDNNISGVIYAKGDNTVVNLTHEYPQPMSETNIDNRTEGSNIILSSAHGSSDTVGNRTDVVAAVYAQSNGEVNIIAGKDGYNYIATDATLTNDKDREQTVWAQQGGKINIDGQTTIVASNADVNTNNIGDNSLGIAITAGTGDISGLEELPPLNTTQDGNEIRSTVNITNASGSSITGDIVSGYGGLINIGMDVNNKTRAAGTVENIKITGNALAANGGKLNINLGNGGTWTGRADDYGDAGYGPDAQNHQNFYNPAFSNDILEGGTVNLTMGDNSTWKVQGQSWITSVDTTNAQNATIDLVEANTDRNTTSHALTIYDLKGNANINMNLDGNRDVSDMLYVKNAQGEYNVALADAVTTEDMYANGLDGLRFATVGAGSNVKFNAGSYDAGVFNVEYEVGTDAYDGNDENVVYNGNSLDVEKPGTSTVDSFFGYQGEDPNAEENTSEIATYARMAEEPQVMALAEEPATETTATTKEATATGATNYKLIARKGESLSDAGKTILNMSKANYSQAVYLDTLNKRLGEARYLEGDEGLWVRMRHDKIDKDSSYEITNNMYELGYDKKYESKDKNGYHRKGVAIDYMDGDTSYDDIAGSGETNRKGIWLYDTWIGNKGHYTDYVAKWGHLENSFDLYTKTRGEKVSGEYDNDVYSLSAEWGYKDQLNNDWYIEPQVQLQYARVTGADYETSQGTQVSVDGIDSLIARAGFRLGKDFGEEKKSTFYVKADVLHEFLGDQDITAIDKTTDGRLVSIGYDNDGTWYSVGLGFSTMLSDNSYAFLDVEKIFGNDNDNSYQINGGFNWLL